jgi:IMP dehydrogenase
MIYADAMSDEQPSLDEDGRLLVAAAISPFDVDRAKMLDRYVDVLVSDIAHFHNINALKASKRLVREISARFVAGNIATGEAAVDAINYVERVDGFRVGLGGGTTCTTALVAGAYIPTLWAVASVRHSLDSQGVNVPIIADGGIRTSGDAVKALAAGASTVMLGFVLAGTDEAEAPLIIIGERAFKPYRGMASKGAMERRFAVDRYSRVVKRVEEGVEGIVPYKGPVASVIKEYVEGIRAGLGYVGARDIKELWAKSRFISAPAKRVEVTTEV